MENEENFNVLALDGGGTRGIYAAQILANIEQNFQVSIKDCFDLIAGTSTGSIIAGAIATDIRMQKIVQIFECKASQIFRKKHYLSPLFISSRYSKKPLEKVLDTDLPSITLGEIVTPLMIMGSDISTGGVYVFKSKYPEESNAVYVRDQDVQLRDAVVASCSAPLFFDPQKVGDSLLADGGLWANNPSVISFTEAISKFEKKIEQIKILSIGTGHTATKMYNQRHRWGLLTGWGREKFISYILDLQSQASTNMTQLLLKENYLRLDPTIDNWALDDVTHLGNLKALANKDFTENARKIKAFMNISGE